MSRISPDTKLEVPSQPLHPDDGPMVASGPSSGSKDGVPRRRDPQLDQETEIRPEPKVEVKLEESKKRHRKELCHLHFREYMISFNDLLNS